LNENKEITCTYKTFAGHVRRLQAKAPASAITPKKEQNNFTWDPLNQTLGGFASLDVKKVDFLENTEKGRRINPRRFDDLVEQIANQPAGSHIIVDTGSSAFVALVHYLVTHEALTVLSKMGHEVVVHTIVTGGQALLDTLHGAAQLIKQLEGVRFVVWLNPFWGPVSEDGKSFE